MGMGGGPQATWTRGQLYRLELHFRQGYAFSTVRNAKGRGRMKGFQLRARLKRSSYPQTPNHEPNPCDVNERFRGFRQALVISFEPAMTPQPSERTFHNPAPRHDGKPMLSFRLAYDFQPYFAPLA